MPVSAPLFDRIVQQGTHWIWTGSAGASPEVRIGGKLVRVRTLIRRHMGLGPLRGRPRETCGVSACVNPEHRRA